MKNFKNFIQNPNQKVVITFDGNVTLARIYDKNTVVSKGIATCCDEDEFDIKAGCELALTRALEAMKPKQEWVVVNRKPRVGDYIRVIYKGYPFGDCGEILRVSKVNASGSVEINIKDHPKCKKWIDEENNGNWFYHNWIYNPTEYEVVEPAPKKPEFRKVNRPPKVGDYIRIVTPVYTFDAPGDVLKINKLRPNGVEIAISDHPKLQNYLAKNNETCPNDFWVYTHVFHDFEVVEKV